MPYRFSRSRASRGTNISYKDSITHRPQGGGPKKQGLLPVVGTGQFSRFYGMRRAGSSPYQRQKLFCINQIGGISGFHYQTKAPSDGVSNLCRLKFVR